MRRDASGNYTLPPGKPVITNTTITSTWANITLSDIASALTGSLSVDGSVTTGKIQEGEVTNDKIADNTVTLSKMADGDLVTSGSAGIGAYVILKKTPGDPWPSVPVTVASGGNLQFSSLAGVVSTNGMGTWRSHYVILDWRGFSRATVGVTLRFLFTPSHHKSIDKRLGVFTWFRESER
jgi:hypothetical protein